MFGFLNNNKIRFVLFQVLAVLIVAYVAYYAISNLNYNIERLGIRSGFDFLEVRAGFDITEHLIAYTVDSSNLGAFYVGLVNTIVVSVIGIIFASILGFIIGIARLSSNYLISKLAETYVEIFRNIPILLQIFFWYNLMLISLPSPRNSFDFFDKVFFNLRGIYLPKPIFESEFSWVVIAFFLGASLFFFSKRFFSKKHDKTGIKQRTWHYHLLSLLGLPLGVYLLLGAPLHFDYPSLQGFNFEGGLSFSPEFLALVLALSIYTATYISEAIRAGIESVDNGQKEAGLAMGLTQTQTLKFVLLPQALRVAIPPIINQYLNLTKNSSLAAAIGYADLVGVFSGTVLNQVGQAIEIILMTMAVYLTLSLLISLGLNFVNHKMRIKGLNE
ncbi:L-amino acid ABC transporter (Glu/Asp/His/...), permease protein 1 AapQ [uncultured Gammaproteobacteria bacterium]|nr:L-amino acid ABC transporter (Glu/Asp/His/...), permease protein 1 AapQ [uncultured Gammaproteobacteria bacterium]CAC9626752.1 L-amino acid ABC transporter (Glu/Asp/His/...), permease protein 1 AapQ [uncultured Gammaproteobacteria bacterium]SHE19565.1 Glutamate Aspartate transport system permease protein GltJ (TC 3.A.1.3.4) [Bathymodiolus brooksi thiotrophic gill symbiont]